MKKRFILLSLIVSVLVACTQSGGSNSRPRTTTHRAVIANINLGVEYMRLGQYQRALDKMERARMIDPGYFGTYNMLGLLHQRLGNRKQAEKHFKKAIKLNKNDPATLNYYGQFLCQTDRPEQAQQMFKRAANNLLYQTPEVAVTNAGLCALRSDNPEEAESFFRRALELDPKIADALIKMSQLSYGHTKYLSARAYLQRYLDVAKYNSKTLWLGILIEQKLGDEDAVSSYALLLKNNFPESKEAKLLQETGTR